MPAWLLLKTFGVPRWLLAALALCAFIGGGLVWHSRKVADALEQSYKQGWADQKARSDAIIRKLDAENVAIAERLRKQTDAKAVAIAVAAERERVLGPGRSALRCPATPAAAGGYQPHPGSSDDAGDRVPANDRFPDASVVPWGWLVSHAQTCDVDANEVKAWRAWYGEVAKGFAAARKN